MSCGTKLGLWDFDLHPTLDFFFDGHFSISWQTNFTSQAHELSLQQGGNVTCMWKPAVSRQAISSPQVRASRASANEDVLTVSFLFTQNTFK